MKIRYFEETDTLYIELRADGIVQSQDVDDDTILDLDSEGGLCAVTMEHASRRADLRELDVEGF